jgi:hypothetical protein
MPVHLKFAMLEILARRPDGRASVDELWREWEAAGGSHEPADRLSEFEDVEVLQSGLVVSEGDSLHITDAGRSVLRALDAHRRRPTESGNHERSESLIDDLIGTELRLKIFDLGLRATGKFSDLEPSDSDLPERGTSDTDLDHTGEIDASSGILTTAPSFLKRNSRSEIQASARWIGRKKTFPAALTSHFQRFSHILRGHLAEGSSNIKTDARAAGISGALVATLSLVALLIGAGLFIGINQIKSLKSEITTLERQLAQLNKQAASADQLEKKNSAEQKNQPQNQPLAPGVAEKGKNPVDNRTTPTALVLSPDEVRLVREYIKPVPFTGPAAPSINVGDPVSVATIPLPSPLTDKIPKLLGARFTIRNGAIIIVKRDSRQVDAVLAPN